MNREISIEKKKSKVFFSNLEKGKNDIEILTIPPGADVEIVSVSKKILLHNLTISLQVIMLLKFKSLAFMILEEQLFWRPVII